MTITIKTNGYKIAKELQQNIDKWQSYLYNIFGEQMTREIKIFYYGENSVFCDYYLYNHSYGQYTITKKSIRFGGHECTMNEYYIFSKATKNDECYKGDL